MEIRKGVAASPGYAVGEAFVLDFEEFRIPKKMVGDGDADGEVARFHRAAEAAQKENEESVRKISKKVGDVVVKIIESHLKLISDPSVQKEIETLIRKSSYSAEYAVSTIFRKKIKSLEMLGSAHEFAQRLRQDLGQVEHSLLRHLLGERREDISKLTKPVVIVADDLTPAQTASFDKTKIVGILTNKGGKTSHTSLIAASLGIPAVVGLGNITTEVSGGDVVVVDGTDGKVIINPDRNTMARYEAMGRNFVMMDKKLAQQLKNLPAETKDKQRITVLANIEFPEEIPLALEYGAEGIGLYRTEFLYLNNRFQPQERDHIEAYKCAIQALGGRKLTIRTLDLGADKMPVNGVPAGSNPFLGVRAIRLCMENGEIWRPQLRAILRVSSLGDVAIMVPMVSTLQEILQVREIISEMKRELREEGEVINENIPVGIMVEVPSIAMIIDQVAAHVDFFSIGTNDLIAYLSAVDRTNEKVAHLYQPAHPAVLRMLREVIATGNLRGRSVSICGEMSSDVNYVILLLGLGLKVFSVVPHMIPEIKRAIRSVTVEDAKKIAETALSLDNPRDIEEFLKEETRKRIPELF